MVTIDSDTKTINANRGDELDIYLSVPFINENGNEELYEFGLDDKISLGIYKKGAFNKKPLLLKEFEVLEPCTELRIYLSAEEMKFDKIYNKEIDYWYEISLNDVNTLIGYDEDGAKLLTLYPEGSGDDSV